MLNAFLLQCSRADCVTLLGQHRFLVLRRERVSHPEAVDAVLQLIACLQRRLARCGRDAHAEADSAFALWLHEGVSRPDVPGGGVL